MITLWPKPGRLIRNPFTGGFFPYTGYDVPALTRDLNRLIASGDLQKTDPGVIPPTPDPAVIVASFLGFTCVDLRTMKGSTHGCTITATGRRLFGDQGGGHFLWSSSSTTPDDGGMVFGNATAGRWLRLVERKNFRNVKWFDAWGDNSHDDTDAIYAAMFSVAPYSWGAEVYLPAGDYKITRTLKWGPATAPLANASFRGESGGGKSFPSASLVWHGPTANASGYSTPATSYEPLTNKSILFQLESFDMVVEGICFKVAPGHACGALVNLGYDQNSFVNALNQNSFECCAFAGGRTLASGTADYALVWDYWDNVDQNTEDCRVIDCSFGSFVQAVVWFRRNTQPFGTQFLRCFMNNSAMADPSTPGFDGNEPYGACFRNDTLSMSLTLIDCDIQRFAAIFYINTHPQGIKVINCHSEATKKLWYSSTGSSQDLGTVHFDAGRYTPDGYDKQSYGPGAPCDTSWAPSNHDVFNFRGDHPVIISSCTFQSEYPPHFFKIHTSGNDLTSIGNRYPNDDPFWQNFGPLDTKHVGRTVSIGDTGTDSSGEVITLPTLRGCCNGGGVVTISGSATFADVVFLHPERSQTASQGALTQSYRVTLSVQTVTGTPTVTTPYLSNYTHTGFRINLSTAPGSGNSITIAYEPWRP